MNTYDVLITTPQPLRENVLSEHSLTELRRFANVTMNDDGRNWTGPEIAEKLSGKEAILASWDLSRTRLTAKILARADRLRIIAYAAGSVRGWITEDVWARGIAVTHAASRIADSVAEYTLLLAMMGLRRPQDMGRAMKSDVVQTKYVPPTYDIAGKKIGLLGMGYVGWRTALLFKAVGAEVWVYDPYLPPERAAELGVRRADLNNLLSRCKVISVHLPSTEETCRLLGAREIALIQDGSVLINTACAWAIDQDALIKELMTGRFWAALDVADPDPVPDEHPLRHMDNVFYTPHVAGPTTEARRELMGLMVGEVERFFNGEPLRFALTQDLLTRMA